MVDKSVSALIILGEHTHGFCYDDKEESDSKADGEDITDEEPGVNARKSLQRK